MLRPTSMSLSSFVVCHFVPSSDLVEVTAPVPVLGELESLNLGKLSTVSKEMYEESVRFLQEKDLL